MRSPFRPKLPDPPITNTPMNQGSRIAMLIVVIAMLIVGGRIVIVSGLLPRMTCTHTPPAQMRCTKQQTWMGLGAFQQQTLANIQHISLAEACDDPAKGCSYSLVLSPQANEEDSEQDSNQERNNEPWQDRQQTLTLPTRSKDQARDYRESLYMLLEQGEPSPLTVGMQVAITNSMGVVFGLIMMGFSSLLIYFVLFQQRIYQRAMVLYGGDIE